MDALQAATQADLGVSLGSQAASSLRELIGIPWKRHGMTPEGGLGCWGVVWYAARYYGYEFPRFEEAIESATNELEEAVGRFAGRFTEVEHAEPGDVVTFSIKGTGLVDHIGIMVSTTRFLHSYEKGGACISRLNSPVYRKRLMGIYRWKL